MNKYIKYFALSLSLSLSFSLISCNLNADGNNNNYEQKENDIIDLIRTAINIQADWIRSLVSNSEQIQKPIDKETSSEPHPSPLEHESFIQDENEESVIFELLNNVTYYKYYDSRFSYTISYPTFLIYKEFPTNGDRCRFSLNDDIKLEVYGANNIFNRTIESEYKLYDIGSYVYSRQKNDWFVISDYTEDGKIFYQKTVLRNNTFITAILYFPPIYKEAFNPIIKKIFSEFPD